MAETWVTISTIKILEMRSGGYISTSYGSNQSGVNLANPFMEDLAYVLVTHIDFDHPKYPGSLLQWSFCFR
jgi:hypothetical protein